MIIIIIIIIITIIIIIKKKLNTFKGELKIKNNESERTKKLSLQWNPGLTIFGITIFAV